MTESLGRVLERARRSLGASLSDAEEVTKIRAKRLEALENGDYDSLPSRAYVRGYLTAYAQFLRIDPAPLLEAYEREAGGEAERVRSLEQVVAPRSQSHHIPATTAILVVIVIALIVGVVWGVGRLVSGPEEPPPIPVVPETTPTPLPGAEPEPGPGLTGEETGTVGDPDETGQPDPLATPEGPFTVRVVVASDSASWLRVTIDDLVAFEGTMAGGQTGEWTAESSAVLRIGRAPAVTVFQDEQEVDIPPGDPPVLELPIAP